MPQAHWWRSSVYATTRDALIEAGYAEGIDFQYYLDEEGIHNESSWAARLPMIFQFLFPTG